MTVVCFRISALVCIQPDVKALYQNRQTPSKPVIWILCLSRTSHSKVQGPPQQNRTKAIAPCGTAQGPPGLSTIGKTQTAIRRLQHARMIARVPSWGAAAVDPTKSRRRGPVSTRSFAYSRSATTAQKHFGLAGRDLHIHIRGMR